MQAEVMCLFGMLQHCCAKLCCSGALHMMMTGRVHAAALHMSMQVMARPSGQIDAHLTAPSCPAATAPSTQRALKTQLQAPRPGAVLNGCSGNVAHGGTTQQRAQRGGQQPPARAADMLAADDDVSCVVVGAAGWRAADVFASQHTPSSLDAQHSVEVC